MVKITNNYNWYTRPRFLFLYQPELNHFANFSKVFVNNNRIIESCYWISKVPLEIKMFSLPIPSNPPTARTDWLCLVSVELDQFFCAIAPYTLQLPPYLLCRVRYMSLPLGFNASNIIYTFQSQLQERRIICSLIIPSILVWLEIAIKIGSWEYKAELDIRNCNEIGELRVGMWGSSRSGSGSNERRIIEMRNYQSMHWDVRNAWNHDDDAT